MFFPYHLQIVRKIEEILKNNENNFQSHFVQKFIGRLVCYTDLNEARRFVKDIYIVLSTERSSVFVEYYVHKELKIKSTILIMLKMKIKKIPLANQQLSPSGNATRTNAFDIMNNVNTLQLKAYHQKFPILTRCQRFFLSESASFGDLSRITMVLLTI